AGFWLGRIRVRAAAADMNDLTSRDHQDGVTDIDDNLIGLFRQYFAYNRRVLFKHQLVRSGNGKATQHKGEHPLALVQHGRTIPLASGIDKLALRPTSTPNFKLRTPNCERRVRAA